MHRGAKPKDDRSQVRHRMAVLDFDEFPNVPFDGPKLPTRYRYVDGVETRAAWPKSTLRWWEKIRRMPHAKGWADTDWEHAFATAELHARIAEGAAGAFTELRARERRMGTTADARKDMRIKWVAPSEATQREEAGEVEPAASNVIQFDPAAMYGAGA